MVDLKHWTIYYRRLNRAHRPNTECKSCAFYVLEVIWCVCVCVGFMIVGERIVCNGLIIMYTPYAIYCICVRNRRVYTHIIETLKAVTCPFAQGSQTGRRVCFRCALNARPVPVIINVNRELWTARCEFNEAKTRMRCGYVLSQHLQFRHKT